MDQLRVLVVAAFSLLICLAARPALATTITLGDQDFVDGVIVSLGSIFNSASAGEPAPFGATCGSDSLSNCATSYGFTFAGPASVTDASFTLGILDADGFLAGDQVSVFTIAGVSFASDLNAFLNTSNTQNAQVKVFTLALPASVFAAISAGNVPVVLNLQGGGIQTFNAVGLDFSSLTFTPAAVPEPATLVLIGSGLAALAVFRRQQRAK